MLSGFDYVSLGVFCTCSVFIIGYFWYLYVWIRRFEEFEERLKTVEKSAKSLHNAVGKLNENQCFFIKPGEPVILYRQEETFHKKEESGK